MQAVEPTWIAIQRVIDERGELSIAHVSELGWSAARAYWITGVPEGAERGHHRHHRLEQLFVAIAGEVLLQVESHTGVHSEWLLSSKGNAVHVPPGAWRVLSNFSRDCVVLVLASRPYEEDDYGYTPPDFYRHLATLEETKEREV
jgi:mannose-6-phosphate isomerase-like protein (cupin superfamily)